MPEVPDDLMKVAREAADDHDAKMESLYGPTASTRRAYMIELIAVALAAERERATLAERERASQIVMAGVPTPEKHVPGNQVAPLLEALSEAILARP